MEMKMKRKSRGRGNFLYLLLELYLIFISVLGMLDCALPDVILQRAEGASVPAGCFCRTEETQITIGGVVPLKTVAVREYAEKRLYPGGMLFGVRCATDGVLVVGFEDVEGMGCPAKAAGIRTGDIILQADGCAVSTVKNLADKITLCGREGRVVPLTVRRGGETTEISVSPIYSSDGTYRAGIWSRDSTAGIGTVTFIDPDTNLFGGLGHGICDVDTGILLPLSRGTTLGVNIAEIVRGTAGAPGELRGCFDNRRTGSLTQNTGCGVFGIFSEMPEGAFGEPLPIGFSDEVKEGKAEIYCTLDGEGPKPYEISITKIFGSGDGETSKNFILEVTDEALLEKTGGIIQGMSGSPVIQDGRLIGAVTHVLVNDPTRGYGIFIETMLGAAGR